MTDSKNTYKNSKITVDNDSKIVYTHNCESDSSLKTEHYGLKDS